ncbi:hypothetical protein [Candidatus Poriferisodalis sp.]|uniref:hypothetical protein n=1 Tax=Candidatus Poriferisodalis sp. TaxID=3101277 RepID=UPI003D0ADB43
MKALTLPQPHASLVIAGTQWFINLPWRASRDVWGQRILIHAGSNPALLPHQIRGALLRACLDTFGPFGSHTPEWPPVPYGAVIGSVKLKWCAEIVSMRHGSVATVDRGGNKALTEVRLPAFTERPPQGWLWSVNQPEALAEPFEARGRRGLWECAALPYLDDRPKIT